MSTVNRVVKNTLFLYARMGTSIVVSVLTTRILLSALGASDYGLYNVVAGALAMLGFLSASMSTASLRYMSYAEGKGARSGRYPRARRGACRYRPPFQRGPCGASGG